MATTNKPLEISFKINAIELISQSVSAAPTNEIDIDELNYNIGIEIQYDEVIGHIKITPTISVCSKDDTCEFGKLSIDCIYEIFDFKEAIKHDKVNGPILPMPFIHTLISIALSTSRGIMFSAFRGTFLQKSILPIVDPTAFVPNPINTAP